MPPIPPLSSEEPSTPVTVLGLDALIPRPVSAVLGSGQFVLTPGACIRVEAGEPEAARVGAFLAARLRPATGFALPVKAVLRGANGVTPAGCIALALRDTDPGLGDEGYRLEITPECVELTARHPAGLFYGVQTLLQMLPPEVERTTPQPGPWALPVASIRDYPRYSWRGVMLDVSRHFFGPVEIKRYIDQLAFYKINRLHLHLSDDQGWRLVIQSWPDLTRIGGTSAVDGDPGGYYTQAEYSDLVDYAARRYVTIVPEIDTPGHTNAALASYPELNRDDQAPALYTGTRVGFSSFCIDKDVTYRFLTDVVGEIAALTPGDFIHIGGDEAAATPEEDYKVFINRIQEIVRLSGKRMVGWEEISQVDLLPSSVVQIWTGRQAERAVANRQKMIVSLAPYAYLDMKYDESTPLGLTWAGAHDVKDFYDWEPLEVVPGAREEDILGVEGPLWSETLRTRRDVEYLTFPRLPGLAEIGWTPAGERRWDEYRLRLGRQGARMAALGIHFYRSPQVEWEELAVEEREE